MVYQAQQVRTGIGTGEAQILEGGENPALANLGFQLGARSKDGKRRRAISKAEETISEDVDTSGLILNLSQDINKRKEAIVKDARDPEYQKQPGWENAIKDRFLRLKAEAEMARGLSKSAIQKEKSFEKEDPTDLKNWNEFKEIFSQEFGKDMTFEEKLAQIEARTQDVEKVFEHAWEVPENINVRKKSHPVKSAEGLETQVSRWELEDASKKRVQALNRSRLLSAKNQIANPETTIRNPEDITYAEEITRYIEGNPEYAAQFNALETPEEKLQYEIEKGEEFLTDVTLAKYVNEVVTKKAKEDSGNGDYDINNIKITERTSKPGEVVSGKMLSFSPNKSEKVQVSIGNNLTEGKTKSFFIQNDTPFVIVSYDAEKAEMSDKEEKALREKYGNLPKTIKGEVIVPFDDIKEALPSDALNYYEAGYQKIREEENKSEDVIENPTEEQYNKLPKGAKYIYNGQEYTKQ